MDPKPASTRARLGPYLERVRRLPPLPHRDQPVLLVSVATVVIALAGVGIRSHHRPELRYDGELVPSFVSFQAFAVPPAPAPKASAPKVIARPQTPVISNIVFPTSPMSRSEGIKKVVASAHSLIGRPYRYGAAGPGAFDCSGFTSYIWRAAGLTIPHNSGSQYASLPRVSLKDLQPGDLVFSGRARINHVGLYIGGGKTIDAPETGKHVSIRPLHGNLIGAARPALLLREDPAKKIEAQAS